MIHTTNQMGTNYIDQNLACLFKNSWANYIEIYGPEMQWYAALTSEPDVELCITELTPTIDIA